MLIGAVPFGLVGITLGYAVTPKAALPIANIGFLLMALLGDWMIPVDALPEFISRPTPFIPTFHGKALVLGLLDAPEQALSWPRAACYLLGWAVLFAATAAVAYRRDDGLRYR